MSDDWSKLYEDSVNIQTFASLIEKRIVDFDKRSNTNNFSKQALDMEREEIIEREVKKYENAKRSKREKKILKWLRIAPEGNRVAEDCLKKIPKEDIQECMDKEENRIRLEKLIDKENKKIEDIIEYVENIINKSHLK